MVNNINRDKTDIYSIPILRFIFKNAKFIFVLKIMVALLFVYAVIFGFFNTSRDNVFTTGLFWGLFWPFFMVLTLAFFGRIFCGICPHGFMGKYLTKIGLNKKLPKLFSNYFIGLIILFIGWWLIYYMYPSLFKTPYTTAIIFAGLTLLAAIFFFVYEKMSYCKYICPIGLVSKAFSKVSFTKLATYNDSCKTCKTFECAQACTYDLKPFTFNKQNTMSDCTLCMDCSNACEAVNFKITKPSISMFKKFKISKAEVWAYLLITAAISITMSFHHALGRSAIVEDFIWTKTARYFESIFNFGSIDTVGLFAFLYAVIIVIVLNIIGMYIASRILKVSYEKTFYTLGYAFAPLFIIGGLSHMGEFFFYSYASEIVNAFIQAFHLDVVYMEPLTTRRDKWVHIFSLFKYIAVIWAFIIMIGRLKLLESSKLRKIIALPFASSIIILYLGLNFYTGYVFKTYGAKKFEHNHGKMIKKEVKIDGH